MSAATFPSLPGVICEGRAPFFGTQVQQAVTGAELRVKRRDVGYRYTLTVRWLRPWLGEDDTLYQFFVARNGSWDSFLFTDPVDSVQRAVRFADDDLDLEFKDGVWSGSIELVTVV
jgi:hypothetical protein